MREYWEIGYVLEHELEYAVNYTTEYLNITVAKRGHGYLEISGIGEYRDFDGSIGMVGCFELARWRD